MLCLAPPHTPIQGPAGRSRGSHPKGTRPGCRSNPQEAPGKVEICGEGETPLTSGNHPKEVGNGGSSLTEPDALGDGAAQPTELDLGSWEREAGKAAS